MAVHASEETRRAQLLEAAKRCFAAQGYHETKVDDIVREAGLSKGALYWYFKSKAELLDNLCDCYSEELKELFLKATLAENLDPLYLMVEIGAAMLERATGDPDRRLIWMEHWSLAVRDPQSQAKHAALYQQWLDLIVPLLERSIAEGKLKPVDPRQLVISLMALFDGLILIQAFRPELDVQTTWRSSLQMFLEGIRR